MNSTSPPMPVTASPVAMPGVSVRSATSEVNRDRPRYCFTSPAPIVVGAGAVAAQAFPDPSRPPITLVYQGVDARTLPPAQSGLSLGFAAFQLSAQNSDTD